MLEISSINSDNRLEQHSPDLTAHDPCRKSALTNSDSQLEQQGTASTAHELCWKSYRLTVTTDLNNITLISTIHNPYSVSPCTPMAQHGTEPYKAGFSNLQNKRQIKIERNCVVAIF